MTKSLLSVQLYTVREALNEDLPGTLARLAGLGFTQVEAFNIVGLEGLGAGLSAAGLAVPTAHQRFIGLELEPIFEKAKSLGIETLIDPHVDDARWQSAEGVAGIIADFEIAAAAAEGFGLKLGYHNHAFEFETEIDGQTAYELFASQLPAGVGLELDTYWAAVGGTDPVALLKKLGAQAVALHIKDGPKTKDDKEQVALGSGSMPVREIIEAAPTALRVVELDDSAGDRFQAVADSVAWLKAEELA